MTRLSSSQERAKLPSYTKSCRWIISEINAGNIGGYTLYEDLTGESIYPRILELILENANISPSAPAADSMRACC